MRIATPADAIYALVARLPILLLVAAVAWGAWTGIGALEARSTGTDFVTPHAADVPPNDVAAASRATEEALIDALNSGDTAQMEAALADAEAAGLA